MKFDPVILSAACNEDNEAYLATKDERFSSRHIMKCVRESPRAVIYRAFLDGHLLRGVPEQDFEEEIIKARGALVKKGIETTANKEFMEKLRKGENPF